MVTLALVLVGVVVMIGLMVFMARGDRSGALEDRGGFPGVGKSGEGPRDEFGPGGRPPHT